MVLFVGSAHTGHSQIISTFAGNGLAGYSGDGGDAAQWVELFPYMSSAGDGVLDLPPILGAAQKTGVAHYFVEQDMVANPDVALKRSLDYLKSAG